MTKTLRYQRSVHGDGGVAGVGVGAVMMAVLMLVKIKSGKHQTYVGELPVVDCSMCVDDGDE